MAEITEAGRRALLEALARCMAENRVRATGVYTQEYVGASSIPMSEPYNSHPPTGRDLSAFGGKISMLYP